MELVHLDVGLARQKSSDSLVVSFQSAMPNESHENILGSILKAKSLIEGNHVMPGYNKGTYFVKSNHNTLN